MRSEHGGRDEAVGWTAVEVKHGVRASLHAAGTRVQRGTASA